ncbi:hypothetical protein DTL21_11660 [Bremerella cremea]|uniref:Uncharacterized protein n=1 Tax=Blastopirellula marina TaxID=124 RepID=A0A2S8FPV5_9BACT|nr:MULTISPECIES: hypothetical protein [Pirellulaceae]PQO34188.1 hypothetical protein C5Y83_11655 [Blastopirellula marina]RCS46684.1 hypothetical protein DTL21_11660 [Bremerella cremea]
MTQVKEEINPFRSPVDTATEGKKYSLLGFWIVLCIAGCATIALLPFAPGFSVMIGMTLAPGAVHAYIRLNRCVKDKRLPNPLLQQGIIISSFFIVAGIGLAAVSSGLIVCVPVISIIGVPRSSELIVMPIAFLLGDGVALAVFVILFAGSLGYRWNGKRLEPEDTPYGPGKKDKE